MALEIERKFLVKSGDYRSQGKPTYIHQGFLSTDKDRVVRIRIYGDEAFLTIKGVSKGIARAEFEYPVPVEDAQFMLENLCIRPTIEKYRYKIDVEGFIWEVDEFLGENDGLVVAEIELEQAEQKFPKPDWVGMEVTGDKRYYNANLVNNPYKNWKS
jgi:adenylate cyclase